ncbi:MAG: SDR family NAD(P)-dependent oxidoreductase, partial [Bacteroidota bacterium]
MINPEFSERQQTRSDTLFSLDGRVAIVTGALGLLGQQHCRALAEAGATVIATDIRSEQCEEFATEISPGLHLSSGRIVGMASDVTSPESLQNLRDAVLDRYGRIDILVNNAAVNDMFENPAVAGDLSKFENYPLEMFQQSLDVNITGVFLCSQILG